MNEWNKFWFWISTVVTGASAGKIFFWLLWNGLNTVAVLETILTLINTIIVLLKSFYIFLQLEKILPKKFEISQNLDIYLFFKYIKVWNYSKY
jgi:hypothetical protein